MRGEYNTRQKRELLSFLKNHDLQHYSVDDLVFEMQQQGEKIGRSTVYRFLETLAEQGSVRKYQNSRGVTLYQHVEDSGACDGHFHMMCRECGKLYHVSCELMSSLTNHISSHHNFQIDPRETTLVGVCARCMNGQEGTHLHGADHSEKCNHSL